MSTTSNTATAAAKPLDRTEIDAGLTPQVRIVHIGLGAFHRAHQAWYTEQVDPEGEWGIAAFTGRSRTAAEQLNAQDGVYTLVTRGPQGDQFDVVTSIAEAHDGAALESLSDLISRASTALITLTVTEAGYHLAPGPEGPELDTEDDVVTADVSALRTHWANGTFTLGDAGLAGGEVRSAAARLVVGLAARRGAGSGPLAVVSCDNLPGNGAAARAAIVGTARLIDEGLAAWVAEQVSFVDTSIDRITPRTTQEDRDAVVTATGRTDQTPVVTEPFTSWVLSGDFPAGRPPWEEAGAVIVEDLEPFERRKLWMLNGAHSLMAYAGRLRGHATVSEALEDSAVSDWVEQLWEAAAAHLQDPELDIPSYRAALRARFENPRIAHHLAQIGVDGSVKLAARAVPILMAEREAGRPGTAALRVIAAWMDQVCAELEASQTLTDPAADRIRGAAAETDPEAQSSALLAVIDPHLAGEADVLAAVQDLRGTFTD